VDVSGCQTIWMILQDVLDGTDDPALGRPGDRWEWSVGSRQIHVGCSVEERPTLPPAEGINQKLEKMLKLGLRVCVLSCRAY
jgi:hypothetical protein